MSIRISAILLVVLAASACSDAVPTSNDDGRIPVDRETVQVILPFSQFATEYEAFPGFGLVSEVAGTVVAHEWNGELESRVLARFAELPAAISVVDGSGSTVMDSAYVPVGGRLVLRMDTLQVLGGPLFRLQVNAIETPWDPETASWDLAVDTLGVQVPWPEVGGGPARQVAEATYIPSVSESGTVDTLSIALDSLTVTEWTQSGRFDTGLRLDGLSPSTRLNVLELALRVDARSSVTSDTVVVNAGPDVLTFAYTPAADEPPGVMRIGGAPATRPTFRFALPESLELSPEDCARVGCPLALTPDRIVFAALELQTLEAPTPGLAPVDSIAVEIRSVLSPERLPRSPLTPVVHAPLPGLDPDLFGTDAGEGVEIPITSFVRTLLAPDGTDSGGITSTVALLSRPEPSDPASPTFHAPGTDGEPMLRLVLTVSDGVPLP